MKFLKVSMLLSTFILLWAVNSFVYGKQIQHPIEVIGPAQHSDTQLIPLMMIDDQLINVKDIIDSTSGCQL